MRGQNSDVAQHLELTALEQESIGHWDHALIGLQATKWIFLHCEHFGTSEQYRQRLQHAEASFAWSLKSARAKFSKLKNDEIEMNVIAKKVKERKM